ncbi:hypothetical protein A0256_13140 [Mucilaginibacter sp. PAMC 26640]|nr:hypothetical protein A0256_13140 [Mucilaginibacter sp. PAMC 26640]
MHYLGNDIDDNDDAEDNRLPFKKADCNTFIQFNVPLTQSVIALKKPWYAVVQHNSYRLSFEVCNAPIDPSFKPPQA